MPLTSRASSLHRPRAVRSCPTFRPPRDGAASLLLPGRDCRPPRQRRSPPSGRGVLPALISVLLLLSGLFPWGLPAPAAALAAEGGGAGVVEVGDPVPELVLEETFGPGEVGAAAADLAGALGSEALVLEMWATWCAPCIAAIPHWNEVVDELAGEPVRFVSISDEEAGQVRAFLERKPIAGLVAVDEDRSVFDAFGVRSIPRTVFIDAEGRLRGIGHPNHVTADTVRTLLAGEELELEDPTTGEGMEVDPEGRPEPLYRVSLRPSTGEEFGGTMGPGVYVAKGLAPQAHVAYGWDVSFTRLALEADLPEQAYDLEVHTGDGNREQVKAAVRLALETAFDLETRTETREREVWLLKRGPEAGEKMRPATVDSGVGYGRGSFTGLAVAMERLRGLLEGTLGEPVLDETGLEGKWEMELHWEPGDDASLRRAVRESLGLVLEPARRTIEVTVVRRVQGGEPEDGGAEAGGAEPGGPAGGS